MCALLVGSMSTMAIMISHTLIFFLLNDEFQMIWEMIRYLLDDGDMWRNMEYIYICKYINIFVKRKRRYEDKKDHLYWK